MDLHATNTYVGVVDEENKVLHKQRFRNELPLILAGLDPFKKDIEGVVVESTFNWYWLVDGLMDQGYRVHLANVSAIKQYEGLKQIDDKRSAFWLANLFRLGILPTGYIYPKEERPTRDLLRKRLQLVRHRTLPHPERQEHPRPQSGLEDEERDVKRLEAPEVKRFFPDKEMQTAVLASLGLIRHLEEEISGIETMILKKLKIKKEFARLITVPGIGKSLPSRSCSKWGISTVSPPWGITPHTAVVSRASGPRPARSSATGTGRTGTSISRGLTSRLHNLPGDSTRRYGAYYEKKMAKTNRIVAIKALSHKLTRASYYVMRDQVDYDPARLFR